MMFRQILVSPSDTHLQRIIWSPEPDQPEEHFLLLTVTYGETCSPYLALRTLQQLCKDEGDSFPEGVKSIQDELYVDDFLSGGRDPKEARQRRDQLVKLLKKGGFELKKWVSNQPELVEDISPSDRLRPSWRHFEVGGLVNELGLAWDPVVDEFKFSPPTLDRNEVLTKRKALGELARMFDPIGWLAPLIVIGKMQIQDHWRAKLSWDEPLPDSMVSRWNRFRDSINNVTIISLPRWINYVPNHPQQLHVFADASRRVMAAAVYSRTIDNEKTTHVLLLAAKTKLTPIKGLLPSARSAQRMTIPRLELRAALLGAKLINMQAEALGIELKDCFAWSDSQVVVHWLAWNQPIGNDLVDSYISHTQELLPGIKWRYVPTDVNPADLADTETLANNKLWWQGPSWLQHPIARWPQELPRHFPEFQSSEKQSQLQCLTIQAETTIIDQFSSLTRLLRTLDRCRRLFQYHTAATNPIPPLAPITTTELNKEFITSVKLAQQQDLVAEIRLLAQGAFVQVGSAISRLNLFWTTSTY